MEFSKFIEWAFMAILASAVTWCVRILQDISKSISQLNTQVGTILEKTHWHEKEIDRHDKRLGRLESGSNCRG